MTHMGKTRHLLALFYLSVAGAQISSHIHAKRESHLTKYLKRLKGCEIPPNKMKRHGSAWVQMHDHFVVKHSSGKKEYVHERNITRRLSKYPHFVTLYYDDDICQRLYLQRVQNHNWKVQDLNRTYLSRQLDYMFSVLALEHLTPSTEFFYGFCCNLFIDEHQSMTLFDFHSYTTQFNETKNECIKAKLHQVLLKVNTTNEFSKCHN